ncbi:MAG: hypothetical protein WBP29_05355 [Candidatus Zixiibacteriota bacterium]
MDTWSIARLGLDGVFVIVIVGVIAVFLYRREKSMRSLIAQYVVNAAGQAAGAQLQMPEPIRETVYEQPVRVHQVAPRMSKPDLVSHYEPQRTFTPPPASARKATRTEKYLEAVRMYRQGSRREDIEKNLGISFMELELLGQLK